MLPDASTVQEQGTLAIELSRCKEGMARVFAIRVQSDLRAGSVAVQTLVRPVLSHHAEIWIKATSAVSRYKLYRSHFPSHGAEVC